MEQVLNFLKKRRWEIDDWMSDRGMAHTGSLARYGLHRTLIPLLDAYARSPCLDAGSGRSPYKRHLSSRGVQVISADRENRAGGVDLTADVQDLSALKDSSVSMVLCTQVLEHVPSPGKAVSEFRRVLAPGGILVLSVPHLSMLHEEPRDYWRYTRHGLKKLLGSQEFEVLNIVESGGLVSFLGHICSLALWSLPGTAPGMRWPVWLANYLFLIQLLRPLDRILGLRSICPCDYVLVARKRSTDEN
jgi:SAM-dependent methyltransferase